MPTFSLILPVYNEEESVHAVVIDALDARESIREATGYDVEVIAVNDGSTDATCRLLTEFDSIRRVDHPTNLGYGVALRSGISEATGELVGFMDGDGTCDPRAFADLIQARADSGADLAIGNRMTPDSQMPFIRRLGNRAFAALVTVLCGSRVTDCASGMRVFPRDLVRKLYPLPDGLHFTPVMTAKALLEGCSILEVPIPYSVRQGQSKLSVIKDGFRFLRSILAAVKLYRPLGLFGAGAALAFVTCFILAYGPIAHYAVHRSLLEAHVYPLILVLVLGTLGAVTFSVGAVAQLLVDAVHARDLAVVLQASTLKLFGYRHAFAVGCVFCASALVILVPNGWELIRTGTTSGHWSYFLLAGLLLILGAHLILLKYLLSILLELLGLLKLQGSGA